ncbi:MAG TPA: hypothetical protein VIK52_04915 [Opitutaceae bacterium]
MFNKVAFTMYPVTDVARARKFYEETLGLTNFIPDAPSDKAGGTIALDVEDLNKLMSDLKAKGVTFKSDVIESRVCRMAVCLDSEGNSILLHQLKPK